MLYKSSKGMVEIDTMPYPYAKNALGKLEREQPERKDEIEALRSHVEKLSKDFEAAAENPRVAIGDNGAPDDAAIEKARSLLSDIELEAQNWFDGADIENDAQADEVSRIIDASRKAAKQFDADRKVEKQPHMDAAKSVDDQWKPLISAAERVTEVAKGVLTPWLMEKEKAKREIDDAAKRKADEAAAEARRLAQENDGSLAAAKARDLAIEEANAAIADAARAERDKASAKGEGMARTVSLRTTWRATVDDRRLLLNHIAKHDPDMLSRFLDDWASSAVRMGSRSLPGVTVWEEKSVA
jgi:hypothetical protein